MSERGRIFYQIGYIEARRNNCIIYIANKTGGIPVSTNINSIMELLPQDQFCRIHRSYIICIDSIKKINRQKTRVYYLNDQTLPVSAGFLQNLLDKITLIK